MKVSDLKKLTNESMDLFGTAKKKEEHRKNVKAEIFLAALRASGLMDSQPSKIFTYKAKYKYLLSKIKEEFGKYSEDLNTEIELLEKMSDPEAEAKRHIFKIISLGIEDDQLVYIKNKIIAQEPEVEPREIYLVNLINAAIKKHDIIVKSDMYLAALNASGVMDDLGEKIFHPDEIKHRYMNSLKDINSSEYEKINDMSSDKVALSVFKIVKEGPEYLIYEALIKEGMTNSDDSRDYRDFIEEQTWYMKSKLQCGIKTIYDNDNALNVRLHTYMEEAERNYKTLILPEIYRKIAIGSTTAGTLIFATPFVAILLGNIFPALAAASSILAASTPIFAAVGISFALLGVFYLKDEKNNVALKNSQLFTQSVPLTGEGSLNSSDVMHTNGTHRHITIGGPKNVNPPKPGATP